MSYLFERRHFNWLANYAKENLNREQRAVLAEKLHSVHNPGFSVSLWLSAADPSNAIQIEADETRAPWRRR